MPELEFRQPSDEWPELVVLLGGQGRLPIFQTLVLGQARIKLGLKECQEQIQQVDAETIGDDVPALRDNYAKEEEEEQKDCARPPVGDEGGRFIEVGLVLPQ